MFSPEGYALTQVHFEPCSQTTVAMSDVGRHIPVTSGGREEDPPPDWSGLHPASWYSCSHFAPKLTSKLSD